MILALPPHEIRENWDKLEPFFAEFERAAGGEYTRHDLRNACGVSRQCWVAVVDRQIKGVGLTERTRASIWLDYCTGKDSEEWARDMYRAVEAWAKGERVPMKAYCRPGWVRLLKEMGFRETHRVMERAV